MLSGIESDTFHLDLAQIAEKAEGLEPTKRNVLSLLASLFDPLGLISPVTVSMKILFQAICSTKFDWDETLTVEINGKWEKWVKDLLQTEEINVRGERRVRDRVKESLLWHGLLRVSYRWWTDPREINYKQNESCPLEGALHSTVRTDVSKDTSTTNEHSTQRITVTTESRWREILARQQNSSQLDPEQGRMEAVRKTRSRRDSHADKQGGMGVLLDCRESSRSWFERSASNWKETNFSGMGHNGWQDR